MRGLAAGLAAACAAGCSAGHALVVVAVTAASPITADKLHVDVTAAGHAQSFDFRPPSGAIALAGDPPVSFGLDVAPAYFGELTVQVDATSSTGGREETGTSAPIQIGSGRFDLAVVLGSRPSDAGADAPLDLAGDLLPFPRCPDGGHLRCEDFESGMVDPALWHTYLKGSETVVDTTAAHSGQYALHVMATGGDMPVNGGIYEGDTFAERAPSFHLRAFVRTSGGFSANLVNAENPQLNQGVGIGQTSDGGLFWSPFGGGAPGLPTTGTLVPNQWACLELEVDGPGEDGGVPDGGALGSVTVWLDGQELLSASRTRLVPMPRTSFEYIYSAGAQAGDEVWIDDILIDNGTIGKPLGCSN